MLLQKLSFNVFLSGYFQILWLNYLVNMYNIKSLNAGNAKKTLKQYINITDSRILSLTLCNVIVTRILRIKTVLRNLWFGAPISRGFFCNNR